LDSTEVVPMIRFPEPVGINEDQQEFPWRKFAEEYNAFLEPRVPDHAKRFGVRYWEYNVILTLLYFRRSDRVVDAGGGFCFFMPYLSHRVAQTYVVDRGTWRNYDLWVRAMQDLEEVKSGRTEILKTSAASMPFADESLDVAITLSALEHNAPPEDSNVVREIWRVLRPGGIFLGTVDFNPQTERPIAWSDDYTYTWESFSNRILGAAPFELAGDIADVPRELAAYAGNPVNIALFFELRKVA
jgi:SAM-dependent methyltransferase